MAKPIFDRAAFSVVIRSRIKYRKLTIRQAGKEAGVSPATLLRIINEQAADLDTVVALCEWLQLTVDGFVTRGSYG